MSKPTLLTPGKVIVQKWMTPLEKRKASYQLSIDFILDFIQDRLPSRRHIQPKIKSRSMGDRVILLKSGTGSGKSTNLPPYIYNRFHEKLHKDIAIAEPRRLTTESIPYDILQYFNNIKMGENIGYQTSLINKQPVEGIRFMTTGILLQKIKSIDYRSGDNEKFLNKYMCLMVDEFHDRSLEVESLLFYIKHFLSINFNNPDCPLIILASATFDKKIYMDYFGIPKENYIEVEGKTFAKELIYENNNIHDWQQRSVDLVKEIHTSEQGLIDVGLSKNKEEKESKYRDILIFVQGKRQIKDIIGLLHLLNTDKDFIKGGYIAPIGLDSEAYHSGGRDYQNVFASIDVVKQPIIEKKTKDKIIFSKKEYPVTRRVIVATNVIETGVTIETLKYCFETGFAIDPYFNPMFGSNIYLKKNISQSESKQRIGRVGRKSPGIVHFSTLR